jgi:hypothetical protein
MSRTWVIFEISVATNLIGEQRKTIFKLQSGHYEIAAAIREKKAKTGLGESRSLS